MSDYVIEQRGDKWILLSRDRSRVLGEHDSREDAEAQEAAIEAAKRDRFTIPDREIFSIGTHNGMTFERKDLDDIVASFKELDYRPALKPGHTKAEGVPALGYVANVRREGDRLLADFVDVPRKVYDAILRRSIDRVSVELWHGLRRGGQTFRTALKAVGLLGEQVPAVAGLAPLSTDLFDEGSEAVENYDHINPILEEGSMGNQKQNPGKTPDTGGGEEDLAAKVTELEQQLKEAETAKAEAEEKAKYAADASDMTEMQRQLNAANERLSALAEERRAEAVERKVNELKIPALRPFIAAAYDVVTGGTISEYAVGEGDKTEKLSPKQMIDRLVAELNDKAATLFDEHGGGGYSKPARVKFDAPEEEVAKRVTEYQQENDRAGYVEALNAVLDADPELKAAYAEV